MTTSHHTSKLRIFLCHSSGDKAVVRNLYKRLRADGFEPWLDEEDLLPGQDWRQEIPKAVRNADVVVVCLSQASASKKGYVQKEIKFALDVAEEQPENTIYIIPIRLEMCEIPSRLHQWQWVNLYEEQGYDRLVKSLQLRATSLNSEDASSTVKLPESIEGRVGSDLVMRSLSASAPDNQAHSESEQKLKNYHSASPTASWVFGSVLLLFLMAVFFKSDLNEDQRSILRFFMALTAAFFAVFFVGGVLLRGTLKGLFISATGGFVLFILIQFVFNPFAVIATTSHTTGDQKDGPPAAEIRDRPKSTPTPKPTVHILNLNQVP